MRSPLKTRKQIPFYYDKSSVEFRQDIYERYDEMVQRQTALHLADELWAEYPFSPVLDWVISNLKTAADASIADLGCGVGRLVGELASGMPQASFWGIDFSYQMLRRTREYWVEGKAIEVDLSPRGLPKLSSKGRTLQNLNLGLAKAENLPFADEQLDAICHSFLLDRLDDPIAALEEAHRKLKANGQLIFISPLNFQKPAHWQNFYPAPKLLKQLENIGFKIDKTTDNLLLSEPLDTRGNHIRWTCLAVSASKHF